MYTKLDLIAQLKELGINPMGTVLVHSSFKSIGEVEGGPETVLDALSEYMKDGLLVLPAHTWDIVREKTPYFYVDDTPTNVGILTELFRHREGVLRSWHPTHSVAALGKEAESFTQGDEKFDTPCARESAYGKLLDRKAQIMLVGVDLKRNTFIHGIEEWLNIPNRIKDSHESLYTVLSDETVLPIPSRRHTASWSEFYFKVDDLLIETNAMYLGNFGKAEVRVCNTVRMTEVLTMVLQMDPGVFSNDKPLEARLTKQVLSNLK